MSNGSVKRRLTGRADVDCWLLRGAQPVEERIIGELAAAFERTLPGRFALQCTDELLLGIEDGRLTLRDFDGCPLAAPGVVYARLSSPHLSTDREGTLLRHLVAMGTVLLNPLDAVLACANKFWQLQQLALAGLPVPDTLSSADAVLTEVIRAGAPEPCVVRAADALRLAVAGVDLLFEADGGFTICKSTPTSAGASR